MIHRSADAISAMGEQPTVMTIGGFDPLGVSGIQADLRVFSSFGLHGLSVLTAALAQNANSVRAVVGMDAGMIRHQLDCLLDQCFPGAIKIGWLQSGDQIHAVADVLRTRSVPIVLDPVLATSSGYHSPDKKLLVALVESLIPLATLITPNIPEAAALLGRSISSLDDMAAAARELGARGAGAVLIKGGHLFEQGFAADFWTDGKQEYWLSSRRSKAIVRGTGCIFAAAVASALAKGHVLVDAVVIAKSYLNGIIRNSYKLVSATDIEVMAGGHQSWPVKSQDLPLLTTVPVYGAGLVEAFPSCCAKDLAFYPIVSSSSEVLSLIDAGAQSIQLRIKSLTGIALRQEIRAAIDLGRRANIQLFINDYWGIAMEFGAYGIHLGQSDLQVADTSKIRNSGLRLGISTHSYEELARARALNPSYIAFGPIFPTTCKAMQFSPQGIRRIKEWRQLCDCPLVVIGGFTLDKAELAFAHGADSVAVMSDITNAENIITHSRKWVATCAAAGRLYT